LIQKEKEAVEEAFFEQKSRLTWLNVGDLYFHRVTKSKHARTCSLFNNGDKLTKPDKIQNESALFSRISLDLKTEKFMENQFNISVNSLSVNFSEALESYLISPLSREEMKKIVFSLNGQKYPGPDSFTATFLQSTWQIVGEDITSAIS
jgi:hypothetical protein